MPEQPLPPPLAGDKGARRAGGTGALAGQGRQEKAPSGMENRPSALPPTCLTSPSAAGLQGGGRGRRRGGTPVGPQSALRSWSPGWGEEGPLQRQTAASKPPSHCPGCPSGGAPKNWGSGQHSQARGRWGAQDTPKPQTQMPQEGGHLLPPQASSGEGAPIPRGPS